MRVESVAIKALELFVLPPVYIVGMGALAVGAGAISTLFFVIDTVDNISARVTGTKWNHKNEWR